MLDFLNLDKLKLVRVTAFVAFLIPMLLTRELWFSSRAFPVVPLIDFLSISNIYFDVVLLFTFLAFFVGFIQNPNWKFGLPVVFIYLVWIVLDQNRIQNFFFEIIYVVAALTLYKGNEKMIRQCLLLIFVGTYFYSGIHKYNEVFFEKWLHGLNKRIPFIPIELRKLFTYAVPFLEAIFGIGLLFRKTRKVAIWLLALMHCLILVTLFLGGYGYTVFPLNVFNVFVLFYLFYNDKTNYIQEITNKWSFKKTAILCLTIVFPCMNFFGLYDHILSFSYLSGKPKYARVFLEKSDVDELPLHIKASVRTYNSYDYIDFNDWANKSIKVLVYPEERVYYKVQDYIEQYTENPTKLEIY